MSQVGKQLETSGGRVNYYLVKVDHPQREEQPPYQAECEDIIEALGLTFDEANLVKEVWRTANERTHGKGKAGSTPIRAAEKLVHYSGRILTKAKRSGMSMSVAESFLNTIENSQPVKATKSEPEWEDWNGQGPHPSKDTKVDFILRDGTTRTGMTSGNLRWNHIDLGSDIIRFRVSK